MKRYFSSIICAISLLGFLIIPSTAKADGYHVWVFWCGETFTVPIDSEQQFFDYGLYEALEIAFCGPAPWNN